jgi:hypothetical protein
LFAARNYKAREESVQIGNERASPLCDITTNIAENGHGRQESLQKKLDHVKDEARLRKNARRRELYALKRQKLYALDKG